METLESLVILSKDMRRIKFDAIIPYDEASLLAVVSPYLAFRLYDISDDNNKYFDIGFVMEKEAVFSCKEFIKRQEEFVPLMETRIERFFISKRANYIYFDEEEQKFLRNIFLKGSLNSKVEIYHRFDRSEQFRKIMLYELERCEYRDVLRYMRRYHVLAVLRPDTYYIWSKMQKERTDKVKERMKKKDVDGEFMESMNARYPKLSQVKSKEQFKTYQKGLQKKYHPDSKTGNRDIFEQIVSDFEYIKESYWYQLLRDTRAEATQQQEVEEDKPKDKSSQKDVLHLLESGGGEHD